MVNATDMTKEMMDGLAFTQGELVELERAKSMPITFDEDCPETTPECAVKIQADPPGKACC